MIRPVTDEDKLQNLEELGEEKFRPEFLNQVTQLRKKVTHCVKPKMLNGKELTPLMLISLAENYVTAINKGAVPNIENAWTYICQNESKKALESAVSMFDDFINDIIYKVPLEESEIREQYREAKANCRDFFVKT